MLVPGSSSTRLAGCRSDIGRVSICSCVMTCATSVRVISMTGASAVTVTDSCSVCRPMVRSRCSWSPIVIVMSRTSAFANPASSAASS
jgi:hypothetical protein